MIRFEDHGRQVVLAYSPEQAGPAWVDDKLESEGYVTLSRTFTVREQDLLSPIIRDDLHFSDEDIRRFAIGTVDAGYRAIRKEVSGLKHDLLIAVSVDLRRSTFVAERDISVFRRIDELVDDVIVVGGSRLGAVPEIEFARLLRDFPTSTELTHYARTSITRVLREYLDTMSDAEQRLATYMERRAVSGGGTRAVVEGRLAVATEWSLRNSRTSETA